MQIKWCKLFLTLFIYVFKVDKNKTWISKIVEMNFSGFIRMILDNYITHKTIIT